MGAVRRRVKGLSEAAFRARFGREAQCRAALFQLALGASAKKKIETLAKRHFAAGSNVVSDGLSCWTAVGVAGCHVSPKHAQRYLASFAWRFNRRYQLDTLTERLAYACARTAPHPTGHHRRMREGDNQEKNCLCWLGACHIIDCFWRSNQKSVCPDTYVTASTNREYDSSQQR